MNINAPMIWSATYLLSVILSNDEIMFKRNGDLPFFPVIGMSIDTGEGNPREVVDICWQADTSELTITFKDEEFASVKTIKAWGWTEL